VYAIKKGKERERERERESGGLRRKDFGKISRVALVLVSKYVFVSPSFLPPSIHLRCMLLKRGNREREREIKWRAESKRCV
jgi:hypothetical protein